MKPIDQTIHILNKLCHTEDIPFCNTWQLCELGTGNDNGTCFHCSLYAHDGLIEHMRMIDETSEPSDLPDQEPMHR